MENDISKTIAVRLAKKRIEYGYTQTGFGKVVDAKQSAVASWESGNKIPDVKTMMKLSAALNVSIDYLVGRTDEESLNDKYIQEQTGLSEKAIRILRTYHKLSEKNDLLVRAFDGTNYFKGVMDVLNLILESDENMVKVIDDSGMAVPTNDLFGFIYEFIHPEKTTEERTVQLRQMSCMISIHNVLMKIYRKEGKK